MSRVIRWRQVAPSGEAFHASRDKKTARDCVPYHGHDFAEVFWIDHGSGIHRTNNKEFPLSGGSVVFMRPTDFHAIEASTGFPFQFTNIAFARETFDFLGSRYSSLRTSSWWHEGKYPISRQLDPAALGVLNRLADQLSQSPRERIFAERFLINLLAGLEPSRVQAIPNNAPEWLIAACREIEKPEHLAGGVERLFRLASRSREHVARACRIWTGLSPTDYVNRVRMTYAARQLEMSSQTVLEISIDCGFNNLSHFYKLFHAEHKTTPRAYRQAHANTL